jgi:LPS-assembly lipoprotein
MGLNYKLTLAALLSLCVSGCGFHLRTDAAVALDLGSVYVEGGEDDPELVGELIDAFERSQVEILDNASSARYALHLQEIENKRKVLSVGADGNTAEFQLLLKVEFTLEQLVLKKISRLQTVEIQREQTNDDAAVLATTDEQAQLFSEMRRDGVREILRRVHLASQALGAS